MVKINESLSTFLDLSRAIAALLVLIGYIYIVIFTSTQKVELFSFQKILEFFGSFGHQAVMVFFVLSGFLVSKSAIKALNENNLKKYTINRVVRLHIVLIPALILTFFMDYILTVLFKEYIEDSVIKMIEDRTSFSTFFGNILFLQDIFVPRFGSNGPLWSLANEFWYYILFPLLILLLKPLSTIRKLIVFLITTVILVILPTSIIKLFTIWLIGAAVWLIKKPIIKKPLTAIIIFFITFFSSYIDFFHRSPFGFISDVTIAISFALIINSLMFYSKIDTSSTLKNIGHFFADFSYSLYLLHFPLLLVLNALLAKMGIYNININSFQGVIIFFSIIFIIYTYSYFVYFFTEKNTLKLQHLLQKKFISEKNEK